MWITSGCFMQLLKLFYMYHHHNTMSQRNIHSQYNGEHRMWAVSCRNTARRLASSTNPFPYSNASTLLVQYDLPRGSTCRRLSLPQGRFSSSAHIAEIFRRTSSFSKTTAVHTSACFSDCSWAKSTDTTLRAAETAWSTTVGAIWRRQAFRLPRKSVVVRANRCKLFWIKRKHFTASKQAVVDILGDRRLHGEAQQWWDIVRENGFSKTSWRLVPQSTSPPLVTRHQTRYR